MIVPEDKKSSIISEMQKLLGLPYVDNSFDIENGGLYCWGFFCWTYNVASEILGMPELVLKRDVYEAQVEFKLLDDSEERRFLDIVVLRDILVSVRHVGVMIDNRWMMHCSRTSNGVARAELTRDPFRSTGKHFGRHKSLL